MRVEGQLHILLGIQSAMKGEFSGQTLLFSADTKTPELRGVYTIIEDSEPVGHETLFTIRPLPSSPAPGDTFVIL